MTQIEKTIEGRASLERGTQIEKMKKAGFDFPCKWIEVEVNDTPSPADGELITLKYAYNSWHHEGKTVRELPHVLIDGEWVMVLSDNDFTKALNALVSKENAAKEVAGRAAFLAKYGHLMPEPRMAQMESGFRLWVSQFRADRKNWKVVFKRELTFESGFERSVDSDGDFHYNGTGTTTVTEEDFTVYCDGEMIDLKTF